MRAIEQHAQPQCGHQELIFVLVAASASGEREAIAQGFKLTVRQLFYQFVARPARACQAILTHVLVPGEPAGSADDGVWPATLQKYKLPWLSTNNSPT
jgi:hypothetical protein